MKKAAFALSFLASTISIAGVRLEIEARCSEGTIKEQVNLSTEAQEVTIEKFVVTLSAQEDLDHALIDMKVVLQGESEPVCTPRVALPWNEPLTFTCPTDENSSVTLVAHKL